MTLENRLIDRLAALGAGLRAWRLPLLVVGAALFFLGAWWSFGQLKLSVADLHLGYLLLLLLVLMPLSLLYSGIGLQIVARSGGIAMPLGQATVTACYAGLAEALPIPGGVIVRSGALMAKGVGLVRSVALVTASAVLWIALAAVGAGFAILPYSTLAAGSLLAIGGLGMAGTLGWLTWHVGWVIAFYSLVHRIAGIVLLSLRLFLSFQAIGVALPFLKAVPITFAVIAGAASSITPTGLGVSEMLGALIADVVLISPAAAFLAVGLDRLLFLLASGLVALAAQSRGIKGPKATLPPSTSV